MVHFQGGPITDRYQLSRALAATGIEPWTQAQAREWWRVNVEALPSEPVSQSAS